MSIRTLLNMLGDSLSPMLSFTDASPPEGERDDSTGELCGQDPRGRVRACEVDRVQALASLPPTLTTLQLEQLHDKAARAVYRRGPLKGRPKRTAMGVADLSARRVFVTLHQTGEETDEAYPSYPNTTSHCVITPRGRALWLHPLDTVLMQTNRLNRSPYHQIGIEVAGCFEALDGSGRWPPSILRGRGRASERQILATRLLIQTLVEKLVPESGGRVEAIVPHVVAGRDEHGRPNRHACPGSRLWSEVGEWSGANLGIAVPGTTYAIGGAPVPDTWHGSWWPACTLRL